MTSNRRIARWITLSLAAAGLLGSAQLAAAQRPPIRGASAYAANPGKPAVPPTAEIAADVEVTWLGDPALFNCHLQAKATASALELCGFVPNEMLKQKAIQIAKSRFDGDIADKLKVQIGMPIGTGRAAEPNELAMAASTYMTQSLGDKVLGLQMSCPAPGRIELAGSVATTADKLEISKCLRGLPGCTHVINQAAVNPSAVAAAAKPAIPSKPTAVVRAEAKPAQAPPAAPLPAPPPPPVVAKAPPPLPKPKATSIVVDTTGPALSAPDVVIAAKPRATGGAAVVMSMPKPEPVPATTTTDGPTLTVNTPAAEPVSQLSIIHSPNAGRALVIAAPAPEAGPSLGNPAQDLPVAVVKNEQGETVRPQRMMARPHMAVPSAQPAIVTAVEEPIAPSPAPPLRMPPVDSKPVEVVTAPVVEQPKPVEIVKADPPKPVEIINIDIPKPIEAVAPALVEAPAPVEMAAAPVVASAPTYAPIVTPAPVIEKKEVVKNAEEPVTGFAERRVPKQGDSKTASRTSKENIAPVARETPPAVAKLEPTPAMEAPAEPVKKPVVNSGPVVSLASFSAGAPNMPAKSNIPAGDNLMGVLRAPDAAGTQVRDAAMVRTAIEAVCRTDGQDAEVRDAGNRRISLTLKVKSAADWSQMQSRIKLMPECAGYSVIYRVAVGDGQSHDSAMAKTNAPMMGVIRGKGTGHPADPDAVRKVIEEVCKNGSEDLTVRPTGTRQVAIAMKVSNSAEWDQLYARLRQLPEISDYSVIFNVRVR